MKRSPLESTSNRLNDDAVGKVVSGIKNDAELFVTLDKEDVDLSFSIFAECDHSRMTGLVHQIHHTERHIAPMRDLTKV